MCLLPRRRVDAVTITTSLPKSVSDRLDMPLVVATNMERKWCEDGKYEILADDMSCMVGLENKHCNGGYVAM